MRRLGKRRPYAPSLCTLKVRERVPEAIFTPPSRAETLKLRPTFSWAGSIVPGRCSSWRPQITFTDYLRDLGWTGELAFTIG